MVFFRYVITKYTSPWSTNVLNIIFSIDSLSVIICYYSINSTSINILIIKVSTSLFFIPITKTIVFDSSKVFSRFLTSLLVSGNSLSNLGLLGIQLIHFILLIKLLLTLPKITLLSILSNRFIRRTKTARYEGGRMPVDRKFLPNFAFYMLSW